MNGLDLFSGCGGISLALAPWVTSIAYCEINPAAQAVLLARMADGELHNAPIWDDVRTLRGGTLPRTDIIFGGFPCQDLSVAGSRAGLEGKRSGLYREIIRLVSEVLPRFVFLENVAGIRSYAYRVVEDLAGLGYDCRWTTIRAADVGAPHLRDRWFLLAHAHDNSGRQKPQRIARGSHTAVSRNDGQAEPMANSDGRGQSQAARGGTLGDSNREVEQQQKGRKSDIGGWVSNAGWWDTEPSVGRVADGVSDRLDKLAILGNAVVPAQARRAFVALAGIKADA